MKKIFTILFLILTSSSVFSQWTQTTGPTGGEVSDITSLGSQFFATLLSPGYGVYVSLDTGHSWVQAGLNEVMLSHIAGRGSTLLASSTQNSANETDIIYRSDDYGSTWKSVLSIPNIVKVGSICAYTDKSWLISAEGEHGKLYTSTDDGVSWDSFQPNFNYSRVIPLVSQGIKLAAGSIDKISGLASIFLSSDFGKSWLVATINNMPLSEITSATATADKICFGGIGGVVYSTDGGTSWRIPANVGFENKRLEALTSIAVSGDHWYVTSSLGYLYSSWDNGGTWTRNTNSAIPANTSQTFSVRYLAPNWFLTTSTGIFKSTDEGVTWKTAESGIICSEIFDIASSSGRIFAATEKGIIRTIDGGRNWSEPSTKSDLKDVNILGFTNTGSELFAYGDALYEFLSPNWVPLIDDKPISGVTKSGSNRLFGARNGYVPSTDTTFIFYSDDATKWSQALAFPNSADTLYTVVSNTLCSHDNVILTVRRSFNYQSFEEHFDVLRSIDNGVNWVSLPISFKPQFLNYAAGAFYSGTSGKGLMRSVDNGLSWESIPFNSTADVNSLIHVGNTMIMSLQASDNNVTGVYRSVDYGVTWVNVNQGMPHYAGKLTADQDNVYSAYAGVWRRLITQVGVRDRPALFGLKMNVSPNPAREILHVDVSGIDSRTSLEIRNVLGEKVFKTVRLSTSESTEIIDIRKFASGVYWVILRDANGLQLANEKFVILDR
ncbi:MAG: T9SS type A sorting domain-containing protein [bacterium]